MKSYGVTIQMKPLQQYFHMVLFKFKYLTKWNLGFVLDFDFRHSWVLEGTYVALINLARSATGVLAWTHRQGQCNRTSSHSIRSISYGHCKSGNLTRQCEDHTIVITDLYRNTSDLHQIKTTILTCGYRPTFYFIRGGTSRKSSPSFLSPRFPFPAVCLRRCQKLGTRMKLAWRSTTSPLQMFLWLMSWQRPGTNYFLI